MKITIDIDDFMEEIKLALVGEWQHLDLNDDDSEAVYQMIVNVISEFSENQKIEARKSNPRFQPLKQ